MVKGLTRQVVVVDSPDRKLFEQAIFIVKEGAAAGGITDEDVLREARRAADGYLPQTRPTERGRGIWYFLAGTLLTGLAWALSVIV